MQTLLIVCTGLAALSAIASGVGLVLQLRARDVGPVRAPVLERSSPLVVSYAPAFPSATIEPTPIVPSIDIAEVRGAVRYHVCRHAGGARVSEYEGHDSDRAYAAWRRMETDPDAHPGEHSFFENDHRRGHRPEGSR